MLFTMLVCGVVVVGGVFVLEGSINDPDLTQKTVEEGEKNLFTYCTIFQLIMVQFFTFPTGSVGLVSWLATALFLDGSLN